jgi:hypothetical protein
MMKVAWWKSGRWKWGKLLTSYSADVEDIAEYQSKVLQMLQAVRD